MEFVGQLNNNNNNNNNKDNDNNNNNINDNNVETMFNYETILKKNNETRLKFSQGSVTVL